MNITGMGINDHSFNLVPCLYTSMAFTYIHTHQFHGGKRYRFYCTSTRVYLFLGLPTDATN